MLHSGWFDISFCVLLHVVVKADQSSSISARLRPLACTLITEQARPYCNCVMRSCQTRSPTLDLFSLICRRRVSSPCGAVCCGVCSCCVRPRSHSELALFFVSFQVLLLQPQPSYSVQADQTECMRAGRRTGRRSVRVECQPCSVGAQGRRR